MRNDRPSQHTNLSFSCVPTWIKWHVKPSKYVNPKQYVRKWMHWWSRIANQIKNPFNHFNRTTLHYTSFTMALHLSSPLSLLIIKMSLILQHTNLSIHYFHAKKSIGQYPLACVSLETLIIIINSSRSEMSRNWWIWNYQQKYANHHKYFSETNWKIQQ